MGKKSSLNEIKAAFQERGFFLLLKNYKNSRAKLEYLCQQGHISTTSWDCFKRGLGCSRCAGNKKDNHTDIEQIFLLSNLDLQFEREYKFDRLDFYIPTLQISRSALNIMV